MCDSTLIRQDTIDFCDLLPVFQIWAEPVYTALSKSMPFQFVYKDLMIYDIKGLA